jgi:hypothetical protein
MRTLLIIDALRQGLSQPLAEHKNSIFTIESAMRSMEQSPSALILLWFVVLAYHTAAFLPHPTNRHVSLPKRAPRPRCDNIYLMASPPSANTTVINKRIAKEDPTPSRPSWRTALGLGTWFFSLSYFIVRNYRIGPWIPLPSIGKQVWVLVHAISNTFFAGGIVLSTLLEWLIVREANSSPTRNPEVIMFWFTGKGASKIDKVVVLPALTLSLVSGFAQAANDYGSMTAAPKHIRLAIHILASFAIWWIVTDLQTQEIAQARVKDWYRRVEAAAASSSYADDLLPLEELPKILFWRRFSNMGSCFFVAALFGLMALKPG